VSTRLPTRLFFSAGFPCFKYHSKLRWKNGRSARSIVNSAEVTRRIDETLRMGRGGDESLFILTREWMWSWKHFRPVTILDNNWELNVSPIEIPLNIRLFYVLLFLHCLMGSIGTLVATNKGYSRLIWLLFGLLGGTLTFFVTLTLDKKLKNWYERVLDRKVNLIQFKSDLIPSADFRRYTAAVNFSVSQCD